MSNTRRKKTRRSPTAAQRRSRRRRRIINTITMLTAGAVLVWVLVPRFGINLLGLPVTKPDTGIINIGRSSDDILKSAPKTDLTSAIAALPEMNEWHPDYERSNFGDGWADLDGDGCNTRNEVLARDLDNVRFRSDTDDCVVQSGDFVDPYTGQQIIFTRGAETSDDVQIDHVVALADAWDKGASSWSVHQRERFANDPLNLLAVEGKANQDKLAASIDEWVPPNEGYRCAYLARQVAVKTKWSLGVSSAEKHTMAVLATECAAQPLPQ